MSMRINQEYMDSEIIKPMMERFDALEKLIKDNDKNLKMKIGWMSDNIAKISKKKIKKK